MLTQHGYRCPARETDADRDDCAQYKYVRTNINGHPSKSSKGREAHHAPYATVNTAKRQQMGNQDDIIQPLYLTCKEQRNTNKTHTQIRAYINFQVTNKTNTLREILTAETKTQQCNNIIREYMQTLNKNEGARPQPKRLRNKHLR